MDLQRANVVLPQDLLEQIDRAVGCRGRSALLVEMARSAINIGEIHAGLRPEEAERTRGAALNIALYVRTGAIVRRAESLKWAFARRGCNAHVDGHACGCNSVGAWSDFGN